MKGWEINCLLWAEEHKKGNCPKCGSSNVEVQEFKRAPRYSVTFSCMDCGNWAHFDGFLPEYFESIKD